MYFLFAASQRVGALLAEALVDAPLDAGAYAFYSALRETQPTSPTDLARHLGMPVTTVLDTLGSLQRREHIARLRNPRDRRSYLVRLTDAGEQLHDQTEALFSQADGLLLAHIGDRRDEVIEMLSSLRDAGETALEELRGRGRNKPGNATVPWQVSRHRAIFRRCHFPGPVTGHVTSGVLPSSFLLRSVPAPRTLAARQRRPSRLLPQRRQRHLRPRYSRQRRCRE